MSHTLLQEIGAVRSTLGLLLRMLSTAGDADQRPTVREYSGDERDQTRGMDLAGFRERMAGIHTDPTTVMVARSPPDKCRQLAPKLEGCSIPARSASPRSSVRWT